MPRRELGVRSQESGDGSNGGCGRAKCGAASPDALVLQHRDFGIHALTVGFEEGGMRGRLRNFSRIVRAQGNNRWADACVATAQWPTADAWAADSLAHWADNVG